MNKAVSSTELNMNELVNCIMKQLEEKDRQMAEMNQTIANLTETINEMKRKLFGVSSEKTSKQCNIDGQLIFFLSEYFLGVYFLFLSFAIQYAS